MARVLADFRLEFAAVRQLVAAGASRFSSLEHNIGEYLEQMVSGATQLGLRLHQLAEAGVKHATIAPYLTDPAVARMVDELTGQRDRAKAAAVEGGALGVTFPALEARAKALQADLQQEINTRQGKFASKALRINQSVNQMRTLAAQVDAFIARDPDFRVVAAYFGFQTPDQIDRLYDRYLKDALTKTAQATRASDQESRWMQSLTLKVATSNHKKAQTLVLAIQAAGKLGASAVKARDKVALAGAQKNAKLANLKLRPITEAYAAAIKNEQVQDYLKHARDRAKVRPVVEKIAACQTTAQQELTKLVRLKV